MSVKVRPNGGSSFRAVATLLVCAAMLALSAGSASAVLMRLPGGKVISYHPLLHSRAANTASLFDTAFSNVDYSGGPVVSSNTNYTIVWSPSNYMRSPFQTGDDRILDYL